VCNDKLATPRQIPVGSFQTLRDANPALDRSEWQIHALAALILVPTVVNAGWALKPVLMQQRGEKYLIPARNQNPSPWSPSLMPVTKLTGLPQSLRSKYKCLVFSMHYILRVTQIITGRSMHTHHILPTSALEIFFLNLKFHVVSVS
jgi:hypothetical protein